ncbi:MAG: hypothetical protein MJZ87_07980 [Bacteroidales bacterium]|nr:hypothetical protein [Bacteroidales bacterium]
MKKHLSLIVMALFASAMLFTACTHEQYTITANANDATMGTVNGGGTYDVNSVVTLTAVANEGYEFVAWNDGNTENPRQITVTADAEYTATFQRILPAGVYVSYNNAAAWEAGTVDAAFWTSDNVYDVFAMQDPNGENYPIADVAPFNQGTGSFSDNYTEDAGWTNSTFAWVEYYEDSYLYNQEGQQFGDWWAKNATINVSAFDATAMTVSANVNATMFDAAEALIDGAGIDGAASRPMTVDMVQVNLEAAKKPFKSHKYNGQKLFVK